MNKLTGKKAWNFPWGRMIDDVWQLETYLSDTSSRLSFPECPQIFITHAAVCTRALHIASAVCIVNLALRQGTSGSCMPVDTLAIQQTAFCHLNPRMLLGGDFPFAGWPNRLDCVRA